MLHFNYITVPCGKPGGIVEIFSKIIVDKIAFVVYNRVMNNTYEEIPGLAKYLPDQPETAELIASTVPPTKCKIKKGIK